MKKTKPVRKKATAQKTAEKTAEPLEPVTIIDPADGPCRICANQVKGRCQRCGKDFYQGENNDSIQNMGGAGFQSVRPDHVHLEPTEGIPGRRSYWAELCINCYRDEYRAVYNKKPPV